MEITQNTLSGGPRFEIKEKEETLGEMVYRIEDNKTLVIEHTYLNPVLRGKNLGYSLLEEVVKFAHSAHLKVKSECTYASKLLERNKEIFKDDI